jgi:integrase
LIYCGRQARELPDNNRSRYRGPTYHAIFALLYGLGLRIGEVSRVQIGDVDLDRSAPVFTSASGRPLTRLWPSSIVASVKDAP